MTASLSGDRGATGSVEDALEAGAPAAERERFGAFGSDRATLGCDDATGRAHTCAGVSGCNAGCAEPHPAHKSTAIHTRRML